MQLARLIHQVTGLIWRWFTAPNSVFCSKQAMFVFSCWNMIKTSHCFSCKTHILQYTENVFSMGKVREKWENKDFDSIEKSYQLSALEPTYIRQGKEGRLREGNQCGPCPKPRASLQLSAMLKHPSVPCPLDNQRERVLGQWDKMKLSSNPTTNETRNSAIS